MFRATLFLMKNAQPSIIPKYIGVYFHRHDRTCIDALQWSGWVQVHNSNGIKTSRATLITLTPSYYIPCFFVDVMTSPHPNFKTGVANLDYNTLCKRQQFIWIIVELSNEHRNIQRYDKEYIMKLGTIYYRWDQIWITVKSVFALKYLILAWNCFTCFHRGYKENGVYMCHWGCDSCFHRRIFEGLGQDEFIKCVFDISLRKMDALSATN